MKVDENEAGKPSAEDLDAVAAEQKSAEATSGAAERRREARTERSRIHCTTPAIQRWRN
jgi:hypothetical protein